MPPSCPTEGVGGIGGHTDDREALRGQLEDNMTDIEMIGLSRGDIVKVQADEDPELEEALVLKVGRRSCLVYGEDVGPTGGFLMWLKSDEIDSVVSSISGPPLETMTIQGRELSIVR